MHRRISFLPRGARNALLTAAAATFALAATTVLAPAASAASVGEFEMLPSSSVDLTSEAIDPATNVIYAQQNAGTKFFGYDPHTKEWTELAEAPIDSGDNGGATYLDGKIYVSYTGESNKLDVYDIATNSWEEIANPLNEGTADITTVGDEIYMAVDEAFVKYNPATETTTTLAKPATYFTPWGGIHPYDGKIYGHTGNSTSEFEVYDIATNEWTQLPSLPEGAVAGGAIDPVTGTYYAEGSYGEKNLYEYDIATETWTTAELPFSTEDAGMAYVSTPGLQGIYIINGETGVEFTRFVTAEPEADLAASETVSAESVTVGGELTYTAKVTNDGPDEAYGVTLADTLPSNATLVSAVANQGSCTGTSSLSCSLGSLEDGVSATVTVTVKTTAAGSATNVATVSSEDPDPNTANDSASATSTVNPVAETKTSPTPTPTPTPKPKIAIEAVGKAVKGGKVSVTLACSEAACTGKVSIALVRSGGKKVALFFSKAYSLAVGKSEVVKVKLSHEGLNRLREAKGKLLVRVRATARGGNITHRFVTLKLK